MPVDVAHMVINHGGERPKAELEDLESIVAFGSAVIPPYYTPILGERAPQAQLTRWTVGRPARHPGVEEDRVHVAETDHDVVVDVHQTGELAGEQVIWRCTLPEYRGHEPQSSANAKAARSFAQTPARSGESPNAPSSGVGGNCSNSLMPR